MLNSKVSSQTRISLQKWASFCTILLCPVLQSLFFILNGAYWLGLAIPILLPLIFGFIYIAKWQKPALTPKTPHPSANKIKRTIVKLATRLGISEPSLVFTKSTSVSLDAGIVGFPFNEEFHLSEDFLQVYKKGLSHGSMKGLIAHELTHVKHHDAHLCYMLDSFKLLLYSLVLVSLIALPVLSLPLFATLAVNGVLVLICELSLASFSRAKESLADLNAVKVTNKKHVVRFIYDRYLQFLNWGKLVLENDRAFQKHILLGEEYESALKEQYRKLTAKNYQKIYHQFESDEHDAYKINYFVQFKNTCLSWFNTHPTLHERVSLCDHEYPSP